MLTGRYELKFVLDGGARQRFADVGRAHQRKGVRVHFRNACDASGCAIERSPLYHDLFQRLLPMGRHRGKQQRNQYPDSHSSPAPLSACTLA